MKNAKQMLALVMSADSLRHARQQACTAERTLGEWIEELAERHFAGEEYDRCAKLVAESQRLLQVAVHGNRQALGEQARKVANAAEEICRGLAG